MGKDHDTNWLIDEQRLACWLFAIERVYRKDTGTDEFAFVEGERLKHPVLDAKVGCLESAKAGKQTWDGKLDLPDACVAVFPEDLPAERMLLWWIAASEWLRAWDEFVRAKGQPGGTLLAPRAAEITVGKKPFLLSGPQRRGLVDLLSALLAVSPWGKNGELHPIEWCFRYGATYDLRSAAFREDALDSLPRRSTRRKKFADDGGYRQLQCALVTWVKLPSRYLSFAGWPALRPRIAIDTYKKRFSFFSHHVGELIAGAAPTGGELLKSPPSDWDCHMSGYVQDLPIGAVSPTRIGTETLRGTLLHGSLTGLGKRCDADVSEGVPSALRWAYQDLAEGSLKGAVEYFRGDASHLSRNAYLGARYFWAFEAVYGERRLANGNLDVIAKSSLWELAALVAEGLRTVGLESFVREPTQLPNVPPAGGDRLMKARECVRWASAYCVRLYKGSLVEGGDRELAKCFIVDVYKKRFGGKHVTGGTRRDETLGAMATQLWRGRLDWADRVQQVSRSDKKVTGLEFWNFLGQLWADLEHEAYRSWREVASETSPAYPPRSLDRFPKVRLKDLLETGASCDVANRVSIRFQQGGVFGEYVAESVNSEQDKPVITFSAGNLGDADVRLLNRAFSIFPASNAELGDNPPACVRAFDEILRSTVLEAISSTTNPCVQIRNEVEGYSWGHDDADEGGEFNRFVHLAIGENDDSVARCIAQKWLAIWLEDLGGAVHPHIDVLADVDPPRQRFKVSLPSDGDGVELIWEEGRDDTAGNELRVVFSRSRNRARRHFSRGSPCDGDLVWLSGRIGGYGCMQAGPVKEALEAFDGAVCAWHLRKAREPGVGKALVRLLDELLSGKWLGESKQAEVFTLLAQWCVVAEANLFPRTWSPSQGGVAGGGREGFTVRFDESVPMGNLVVHAFGLKGCGLELEFEGYQSAGRAPDGYAELAELSGSAVEVSGELRKFKSLVDDFPGVVLQRHQDSAPDKHPHLRGDAVELFEQVWLLEKPQPSGHDDVTENVYGRAVINLLKQVCGVTAFWPIIDDGLAWFADSKGNPLRGNANRVTKKIRPALKTQDGARVLAANVEVSE